CAVLARVPGTQRTPTRGGQGQALDGPQWRCQGSFQQVDLVGRAWNCDSASDVPGGRTRDPLECLPTLQNLQSPEFGGLRRVRCPRFQLVAYVGHVGRTAG